MALVALEVIECWSNVPAKDTVISPGSMLFWFFMDKDFGSEQCHGVFVKVALSKDASVCRQLWVGSGRPQEIQRDDGLEDKTIPEVFWELWIASSPD